MPPEIRLPDVILTQLRRLRSRIVGVSVADGIGLTLFTICSLTGLALILDYFVDMPVALRLTLLLAVPILGLVMAGWTILRPLMMHFRNTELAAVVESAHPELRERLLSIVELEEAAARGEETGSQLMRSYLLQQTVNFAQANDFGEVVDARRAIRRCWLGGIALLALLLPLIFATNAYAVLLSRFLHPWGNYERMQNLMLTIEDPDRVVGRDDDVTFIVHPGWRFTKGEFPEAAWLNWTPADGKTRTRRMEWNAEEQVYSLTLPRVHDGFVYHVSADGARTRQHRIDVVDRPEVTRISVDITPPAYTGEPAIRHDALLGEILAIEQSQLVFDFEFNKPLTSAEIIWLDQAAPQRPVSSGATEKNSDANITQVRTPLPLSADQQSAQLVWTAALKGPSGRFVVRTTDEHGLHARTEPVYRLTIQPDMAPLLEFADNEQHPTARPEDTVRIPIQASDDFGLAIVELHYELKRNGVEESGVLPVPAAQLGGKELWHVFDIDLHQLQLEHGMEVALRARATDDRPVPGPNETWTGIRLLQIRDDARPYGDQTLAENQHRVDQAMDKLKGEIEKQRQAARQLQADAQANESRKSERRGDEEARNLEDDIRELSQQMQKLQAVLEQQPLFQPLAEQIRDLSEQELARAAMHADQAQQVPLDQKQQQLSEAANQLQSAENKLQDIQEQHRQLAQMQRDLLELNRLAENTEKLAEQVDSLAERLPRNETERAALPPAFQEQLNREHQQLVRRHEQLTSDLDHILEEHPELVDLARENLRHELASLGEQTEHLARQQSALAKANQEAARKAAKESGLLKKQDQLLQAEKRLAGDLELPMSDEIDVNGARDTRAARQLLEKGDFGNSQDRHRVAQQQLAQLADALKQNHALPADPVEKAEALVKRQAALQKALDAVSDEESPQARQTMTQLAAEQAAIHRAAAELPQLDPIREARQQSLERTRDAGQNLANGKPNEAREQVAQAQEQLQKLAKNLKAASEDPDQQARLQSDDVQRAVQQQQDRSAELLNQSQQLAQQHQQLAQEIAAASGINPPDQPDMPAAENDTPAMVESDDPSAPPSSNELAELVAEQQRLLAESRQLGEDVRDLRVKNESANQASAEFPNVSRALTQKLEEADFDRAGQLSKEAVEKAKKLSEALASQNDGTVPERLVEQARSASQRQEMLAERIQELAESKAQQAEFLRQRQQQLRAQTEQLAESLNQKAGQLRLDAIDRKPQADIATQGRDQLRQAAQTQQEIEAAAQQGNSAQAREAAEQSAAAMRDAAKASRQASDNGNPHRALENPAQGEVGKQIAESAQHLDHAGEQLSKLGQPQSAQEPAESVENSSESPSGDAAPMPDGNSPDQAPDSNGSDQQSFAGDSQASESLRQAARNMRQAAEQLGLAMNGQQMQSQQQQTERQANQSTGFSPSDSASDGDAHLSELEFSLGTTSERDWGKLPGTLQAELFESSQRQRDATYRSLIRRYFDEISRARPAQLETAPPQ